MAFLRESQNDQVNYNDEITSKITSAGLADTPGTSERDVYFVEAGKFIIEKDKASIGMLQRVFKIGFNRAARIMEDVYKRQECDRWNQFDSMADELKRTYKEVQKDMLSN